MIKALKVTLLVAAIVAFFWGILMLIAPGFAGSLANFPEFSKEAKYFVGLLGAVYVALGVGFVLASRDPVKNIAWVQAGIVSYALSLVISIYYLATGSLLWRQAIVGLVIQIGFLTALSVLYPRKQPG
ncbi:hypothetical protein NLC29_02780 [Candidatus Aminicenantes bacterium AH-873-B07]|jgi:hypothetical protein|nr:hypothetical protein [Candidatus Aminicenantes bacterium AH-873-B07]